MSYVAKVLQPGETVLATGKFHWIIYLWSVFWALLGIVLFVALTGTSVGDFVSKQARFNNNDVATIALLAFLILAAVSFVRAWFRQWTTELAITDHRVIYKTGFIKRITAEMNMGKVDTVQVDQPVLGRLLNYGTIHIRGTGTGIEHLDRISDPLALRTAITAK
jgi:uncharacterized membrane protein YdbT with pleckstrin-like domain